jgi:hypothetical protein
MSKTFILPPRKVSTGAVELSTLDSNYLRLDGANSPMTGSLDMGSQLLRVGNLSSNPSGGEAGQLYFNTVANQIRVYDAILGWQSIIADTNITLNNATANQMNFIGGSGVDGGGGNLTFRVTASASTAHTVSINSLGTSFTIVGGISPQRTLTVQSSVGLNGQGYSLTLSSDSQLNLNSHILSISSSTGNITLKPSSTTATIYNIATHADNSWLLSVGNSTFPGSTGALFYSTSSTFGQLSALSLGTEGYVLTAGASAPTWSNIASIALTWIAPISITYNPSNAGAYAVYNSNYGLNLNGTPRATADGSLIQIGTAGFSGGGGTNFSGSSNGTFIGVNSLSAFTGNLLDMQIDGVTFIKITNSKAITIGSSTSTIGFYGQTPAARPSAYTVTNGTTDRSFDADATSLDEIADVLGTLINDLKTIGLLQ